MRGREKYQCLKSQCADCYSPRIGLCNSRQNSPSFIFRPVIFSCVARPRLPSLLIREYKIADRIAKLVGMLGRGGKARARKLWDRNHKSRSVADSEFNFVGVVQEYRLFFQLPSLNGARRGTDVRRRRDTTYERDRTDFGAMENCIVGGPG